MTSVVATALAVVTALCLGRCVIPAWRSHGALVEVWHVAMGLAMVAMLLLPVRREPALLQILLFVVVGAWCTAHLAVRHWSAVHLRLAAACAAMVAMLVPVAFASPASAAAFSGGHHQAAGPLLLHVALLAGTTLIWIFAVRAVVRGESWQMRLGATCEAVMAGGMAYMALLAL